MAPKDSGGGGLIWKMPLLGLGWLYVSFPAGPLLWVFGGVGWGRRGEGSLGLGAFSALRFYAPTWLLPDWLRRLQPGGRGREQEACPSGGAANERRAFLHAFCELARAPARFSAAGEAPAAEGVGEAALGLAQRRRASSPPARPAFRAPRPCPCAPAPWCRRQGAMDLGVYQLRHFSISFLSSLLGTDSSVLSLDSSSSGASVVAIDNKIEQAMDLVKSHLMYAVREEVEVLKEQIKDLIEKNNQLEQENNLLKTLASPEQLAQFQAQLQTSSSPASSQTQGTTLQPSQPAPQSSGPSV
ncbi:TSC22 domain family protein 1 isoform 3-T3 [Liasis olivaceus]